MALRLKPTYRPHGPCLSDKTIPSDKEEELQQISEDADKVADILIAELQRCAAENRAQISQRQSTFDLNTTELSRLAKSAVADAARVQQARRGNDLEDNIAFADEVLMKAAEARAASSLASEIRRVSNKSSVLNKEITALQKVVQTAIHFNTPESMDVVEWKAEAMQIEEKTKVLRKKLENLRVPSQSALQKRHEECEALKSRLVAAEDRLKRYDSLPPSLTGASQKLQEAREQLALLRSEIRNSNARALELVF